MTDTIAIHGHDIIDLVTTYPEGSRLSQLMEIVAERYGRMATFHTCSEHGMGLVRPAIQAISRHVSAGSHFSESSRAGGWCQHR